MKSSDRTILVALGVLGVLAAAWFLLISPKRDEVAKLDEEITTVRSSLAQQQQLVATANQAKKSYDSDYTDLVVLGKAVPEEEETSSLFVELEALAQRSGATFASIELTSGTGSSAPPPPPAAETETDDKAEEATATAPTTPVATEAAAALLPIGATIGPAGLPVMPYTVKLSGDFFQFSDFLAGVDSLVQTAKAGPIADGRLITIDGFELTADSTEGGGNALDATLSVTTYVAPASQGLTGGATPAAPATSTTTTAVPTATGVPTP